MFDSYTKYDNWRELYRVHPRQKSSVSAVKVGWLQSMPSRVHPVESLLLMVHCDVIYTVNTWRNNGFSVFANQRGSLNSLRFSHIRVKEISAIYNECITNVFAHNCWERFIPMISNIRYFQVDNTSGILEIAFSILSIWTKW